MDKEIIFKGEWFLPNNIENKIIGTLTFIPSELYSILELFGSLGNDFENDGDFNLILGKTIKGDHITLYNCRVFKSSGFPRNKNTKNQVLDSNILQTSSLNVECIFTGIHIDNLDDLVFKKIETEIYNLEDWVGIDGFSRISREYIDKTSLKIDFNYLTPKPIEFKINDTLGGAFNFLIKPNTLTSFQKEYNFIQTTFLSIISSDYLPFNQFLENVYIFQNFLVISMYSHTNTLSIEFFADRFTERIKGGIENEFIEIPKRIKFYKGHRKKIERERPKRHFEMLFTYDDIKEDFPIIIINWFEKYNILSSSFNLFFYQFYLNERYIDVLFLNLAQAAETLHYHLNPERKRIDVDKFKQFKKELKEKLPIELFSWVNDELSNHLYLDTRLNELIEKYSNKILLKRIGETKIFIKNIKDTRNYLTHFNPELKNKSLKGIELVDLYEKLQLLLITAILIESGFSKELVEKLFVNKALSVFNINV
jgi:hypothetical protein